MTQQNPNLTLLSKLDVHDPNASAALFLDEFVWHSFNPKLRNVEGDFVGANGSKDFLLGIAEKTAGTFLVEAVFVANSGDKLVVVHAAIYAAVMVMLVVINLLTWPGFIWFIWPLTGLGFFVALPGPGWSCPRSDPLRLMAVNWWRPVWATARSTAI